VASTPSIVSHKIISNVQPNTPFNLSVTVHNDDGNPPALGYPKLTVLYKNNVVCSSSSYIYAITGSSFTSTYSVSLSTVSSDFSYYFETAPLFPYCGVIYTIPDKLAVSYAPSQPSISLSSTKDGQMVSSGKVFVSWDSSDLDTNDNVKYDLYISSAFNPIKKALALKGPSSLPMALVYSGPNKSYTFNSLDNGRMYYWRADATDSYGFKVLGNTYTFYTLALKSSSVFNYPNPFLPQKDNVTSIVFFLEESGPTDICIYSEYGKLVFKDTVNGFKGSNEYQWNGRDGQGINVFSGSYPCIIKHSKGFDKCHILVIR
jgi:hypothetical protein